MTDHCGNNLHRNNMLKPKMAVLNVLLLMLSTQYLCCLYAGHIIFYERLK